MSPIADPTVQAIAPEVTSEQIDAVLAFLPCFEEPAFEFGHWVVPAGQFPYVQLSAEAAAFLDTLYAHGFIFPYDWGAWKNAAERYWTDPDALANADLITLCKLLTFHVRADRFNEGHLLSMYVQGHLTAILHELRETRAGLETQKV